MEKLELKAKFIRADEIKRGTSKAGKEWATQTIWLETLGQYPDAVAVKLPNQKMIDRLEEVNPHFEQEITIAFNLKSREYNGNAYTEVIAWKI
jgi:hypothetical protein